MIIDSLENAHQYYCLHPRFKNAFKFLEGKNLENFQDGSFELEDGLKMIVSNKFGKTREESLQKFECHNRNIDIQICVKGNERIEWKSRKDCKNFNGNFNEEKDVQFFNDEPDTYFKLKDGQFAIFFPEDVHAPMIGDGEIKKLVFKVKI